MGTRSCSRRAPPTSTIPSPSTSTPSQGSFALRITRARRRWGQRLSGRGSSQLSLMFPKAPSRRISPIPRRSLPSLVLVRRSGQPMTTNCSLMRRLRALTAFRMICSPRVSTVFGPMRRRNLTRAVPTSRPSEPMRSRSSTMRRRNLTTRRRSLTTRPRSSRARRRPSTRVLAILRADRRRSIAGGRSLKPSARLPRSSSRLPRPSSMPRRQTTMRPCHSVLSLSSSSHRRRRRARTMSWRSSKRPSRKSTRRLRAFPSRLRRGVPSLLSSALRRRRAWTPLRASLQARRRLSTAVAPSWNRDVGSLRRDAPNTRTASRNTKRAQTSCPPSVRMPRSSSPTPRRSSPMPRPT